MILKLDPDLFLNPEKIIHTKELISNYMTTYFPIAKEEIKKFYPVIFDRQEKLFNKDLQKHIGNFIYGDNPEHTLRKGIPHPKSPRMSFKSLRKTKKKSHSKKRSK